MDANKQIALALRLIADKLIDAIDEQYINRNSVDADTLSNVLHQVAEELEVVNASAK